jgi:hypothetical protein
LSLSVCYISSPRLYRQVPRAELLPAQAISFPSPLAANDLQNGCAVTLPVLGLWLLLNAYLAYRNVIGRFSLA